MTTVKLSGKQDSLPVQQLEDEALMRKKGTNSKIQSKKWTRVKKRPAMTDAIGDHSSDKITANADVCEETEMVPPFAWNVLH